MFLITLARNPYVFKVIVKDMTPLSRYPTVAISFLFYNLVKVAPFFLIKKYNAATKVGNEKEKIFL